MISIANFNGMLSQILLFTFVFTVMSSTPRRPILANLKPSPLNVQSNKAKTVTTASKSNASSHQCVKPSQSGNSNGGVKPKLKPSQSGNSNGGAKPKLKPSRMLPSNRYDTTLSGRTRKRVREEQDKAFLEHPHSVKLRSRKRKLVELMLKIYELADTDLLVSDMETGLNDYSKNLKFADELDDIAKHLIGLSTECTEKANVIRDKVATAKEDKRLIQDIVHIQDVIKVSEQDPFIAERAQEPVEWVHTNQFRVKHERPTTIWASSDEETENFSSNPDTKFKYAKKNENDEIRYVNHICIYCDKTLRDSHELRNHLSNHAREVYRCLKCPKKLFRSEQSYLNHKATHIGLGLQVHRVLSSV